MAVPASLGLILVLPANAADDAGLFEIVNASYRDDDGDWLVDARADLRLSSEALEALQNSIALNIQYQYQVTKQRSFWPDDVIVERKQNFELRYLSLTQRYSVRNTDTGEQSSYATVYSALRQISRIRDFPVVATDQLNSNYSYQFSLRAVLNREELPGPLRVLAFWQGDYSLESAWYRWTLKR